MTDALRHDERLIVVYAVQHAVRAAPGAVQPGQFTPQRLADSPRFARQVAEGELNQRREHSRRQLVQVTPRGGGEPNRVGQRRLCIVAPWNAELGANLVFAVGAARGDVGVGLGDRLFDARLRQPVQRLLQ